MVGTFMVNLAKQTGVWVEINRRQETALLSMRGIDLEHNRCIIVLIILAVNNVVKYQKEPRPLKPAGSRVVSEYKIVMLIEQGTASMQCSDGSINFPNNEQERRDGATLSDF
jgi:hypothetical protein